MSVWRDCQIHMHWSGESNSEGQLKFSGGEKSYQEISCNVFKNPWDTLPDALFEDNHNKESLKAYEDVSQQLLFLFHANSAHAHSAQKWGIAYASRPRERREHLWMKGK